MINKELCAFAVGVLVGAGLSCMGRTGVGEKIAAVLEEKGVELKKGIAKASKHAKGAAEEIIAEAN